MGFLHQFVQSLRRRSPAPTAPAAPAQPAPLASQPKSLAKLEQELAAQASQVQQVAAPRRRGRQLNGLLWKVALVGIPIGCLWLINLPYPPIRRPVARTAPILLLPSYISLDRSYREAAAHLEAAAQLIDRATAPADLDRGADKLEQAKASLDKLSLWDWDVPRSGWYGWYGWSISFSGLQASRAQVGQLEAKLFQERNAQTALLSAEQAIATAKQQYQQAKTAVDQQQAIATWQTALDQLQPIPGQTLAGKTAQQTQVSANRDFEAVVGVAADDRRTLALIAAAQGYAMQAAQFGQNPPHSVEHWQQVSKLWQEAIAPLQQISPNDPTAYTKAQQMTATYEANLAEIQVREQAEADAEQALQSAKRQIQLLLGTTSSNSQTVNRSQIGQLQGIIDTLETIAPGTTAYLEAQNLLLFAKNRLNQLH